MVEKGSFNSSPLLKVFIWASNVIEVRGYKGRRGEGIT
jgi:hypothetical protein